MSEVSITAGSAARPSAERPRLFMLWVGAISLMTVLTLAAFFIPWLREVPEALVFPVNDWINTVMAQIVHVTQPFFRILSWVLAQPMAALQRLLSVLPWLTVATAIVGLAWIATGRALALFAAIGVCLTLLLGYWPETMNTLALVGVSVPLSVALGFGLGTLGFLFPSSRRVLEFTLDLMQTVPAFAYLIPILLLFGFGPVVGLMASAIYAAPPMVRNTMLGLGNVPGAQIESGELSGCSGSQLFWLVRVPGAMPQILVGVNQTTMQALSMVIIAAIIGGFDDIGWAVLTALRKAQFGQSLMAGLCIVFIAVLIDRITWGFAEKARMGRGQVNRTFCNGPAARLLLITAATLPLGLVIPALAKAPSVSLVSVAEPLNDWLEHFLIAYGPTLAATKTNLFYVVMLPLRAGLETAITPFTWGYSLTPGLIVGYWVIVIGLSLAVGTRSLIWGCTLLFMGWLSYFGFTGVSWVALSLFVVVLGYSLGGIRTAILSASACLYLVVTGLWDFAMLSLYLCGAAVVVSLFLGGAIGAAAAHSDRLSKLVRGVADTLQTMPQFVLLIPFLMFFQVGEFTALLAIIIYAIVPAMRYTEQGLRGVNCEIIEAAHQMGCTEWQILWRVRILIAMPVLALGINQTIMFGLAMLAITALVGTQDLGQQVYVALSQADAGQGLLAGLGIAVIALLSDRLIRDWIALIGRSRRSIDALAVRPPV